MTAYSLYTLIELSGVTDRADYQTYDTAVPVDHHGNYPHNGNAVSVYWRGSLFPQIISYRELAQMAFDRGVYLQRWQREWLREIVKDEEDQL